MKELSLPARMHLLANNLVDAFSQPEKTSSNPRKGKNPPRNNDNRADRKEFRYYQPVYDDGTQSLVGHLADISSGGFKLDCRQQIPVNTDFRFRINLTPEVADKQFMIFVARSRWCRIDPLDPCAYNVGFQLVHISPDDFEIFNRMIEKYGSAHMQRNIDLRRSYKW